MASYSLVKEMALALSTDSGNFPFLYECQWKQGLPIGGEGRYVWINIDNKWYSYEGTIDEHYLITGACKWNTEDGEYYGRGAIGRGADTG